MEFTFLNILGSFPRMWFMHICMLYSVSLFLNISRCSLKTGFAHLVPIDRSPLGNMTERKKQVCVN